MPESDAMKGVLKQKESSMIVKLLCLIKAFSTIRLKSLMMIFHSNFTVLLIIKGPVEISHHQVN